MPRIVAGSSNRALALAVADLLGTDPASCDLETFPDGELRPVVREIRGGDVYVVQPTDPPVNDHLIELLLLLDACRRAGARRVTAVVPYFGYARQDRRLLDGQPVGARVCADALQAAGADRLVVVDPHAAALEAMFAIPVETLSAVPAMAAALARRVLDGTVVVAPDLGAVKLAERYAATLRADTAVVRKSRVSGTDVRAREITGDVRGRPSIIVDDMISTGATIEAAVTLLRSRGGLDDVTVAATHGVLVGGALERIGALGVRSVLTTDTVGAASRARAERSGLGVEVCSVAPVLAETIALLHADGARAVASARDVEELGRLGELRDASTP